MTLGELKDGMARKLVAKEALLGILNGALVGITAGAGMFIVARLQSNPLAGMLAFIVAIAMLGSCLVSGVAGAVIPLGLKRLGADPATASSILNAALWWLVLWLGVTSTCVVRRMFAAPPS